jgi:hypothetical protein
MHTEKRMFHGDTESMKIIDLYIVKDNVTIPNQLIY